MASAHARVTPGRGVCGLPSAAVTDSCVNESDPLVAPHPLWSGLCRCVGVLRLRGGVDLSVKHTDLELVGQKGATFFATVQS